MFGCSGIAAFRRIVLPLALPGVAATAIFAFVISWNEVFAASVLTVRHRTLTAYLLSVLSESPLQAQFAGGLLLIVPSVLFIFAGAALPVRDVGHRQPMTGGADGRNRHRRRAQEFGAIGALKQISLACATASSSRCSARRAAARPRLLRIIAGLETQTPAAC